MTPAEHAATALERALRRFPGVFLAVEEEYDALVAQAERADEYEARTEAAEARAEQLQGECDAARLVPPLVRQTLEKALRADMTQPPVSQAELRAAIDLLPDSPSFYSSVHGMEQLAEVEERAERAEAALRDGIRIASQYFDTGRGDLDGWVDRAHAALAGDSEVSA